MTLRHLSVLSVALFALGACSGDDENKPTDNTPTDGDATSTEPTIDTVPTGDPGPDYFDAIEIHISASFGYDATTRAQIPVEGTYSTLTPQYVIALSVAGWQDFAATDQYCVIILPFDNATPRPEAIKDKRLYYGINYDPVKDIAGTDCNTEGYELDPNVWGADPAAGFLTGYESSYWLAVGEPTQTITDVFLPYPDLVDIVVGGSIGLPDYLPTNNVAGQVMDTYTFVYEIDPLANLVVDKAGLLVSIDNASIWNGSNMATGYYSLNSLIYWTLTAQ